MWIYESRCAVGRNPTAELFFDLVDQACMRQSLVVNTNLPFEHWTKVFRRERPTGAALDRFSHRCVIFEFIGEIQWFKDSQRQHLGSRRTAKS
jgi:DNA replication protein DnaC